MELERFQHPVSLAAPIPARSFMRCAAKRLVCQERLKPTRSRRRFASNQRWNIGVEQREIFESVDRFYRQYYLVQTHFAHHKDHVGG